MRFVKVEGEPDGSAMTDLLNDLHPAVLLGAVLIAIGATVALGGLYYAKGWVKRNWITGIRTFSTLRDDRSWDAAHRAAARWIGWSGVPPFVAGIWLVVWRPEAETTRAILAAIGILGLLVLTFVALAVANRAAKDASDEATADGG